MSGQKIYLIVLNEVFTDYDRTKTWIERISDDHPAYASREEAQRVVDELNEVDLNDHWLRKSHDQHREEVKRFNDARTEKIRILRLARSTGVDELIRLAAFHDTGYRKEMTLPEFAARQREDDDEAEFYEVMERELHG